MQEQLETAMSEWSKISNGTAMTVPQILSKTGEAIWEDLLKSIPGRRVSALGRLLKSIKGKTIGDHLVEGVRVRYMSMDGNRNGNGYRVTTTDGGESCVMD